MDELVKLVQQVGFPIAVSIYLLWRYEKRLQDMNNILGEIAKTLAVINEKLNDNKES